MKKGWHGEDSTEEIGARDQRVGYKKNLPKISKRGGRLQKETGTNPEPVE